MWIAMVHDMSGARYDDRMWPGAGIPIEVPDWEGEALVADHDAIEVPPPPPPPSSAPKADWVDHAVDLGVPPDEAAAMTKAELIGEAQVPEPVFAPGGPIPGDGPEPPKPADPKQAWMDYAVTQGMTEDQAGMMTKADLMSRFGGRL